MSVLSLRRIIVVSVLVFSSLVTQIAPAENVAATLGSAESATRAPLRVCLLSGCKTYASEESLPPFQEWLESHWNVECRRLVRVADDDLPGLDQLEDCDVLFVFFKRMHLKGKQLESFQRYVRSGKPIVAVRTASHAVQTWLDFDREILGGNYQGHYEKEPETVIQITESGLRHPVLRGIELKTAPGPLYKNSGHAGDIQILMTGTNPGHSEPIAWAREINGGRLFYTSLGDPRTFADPEFRQMLANAVFWVSGSDAPLPRKKTE